MEHDDCYLSEVDGDLFCMLQAEYKWRVNYGKVFLPAAKPTGHRIVRVFVVVVVVLFFFLGDFFIYQNYSLKYC